MFTVLTRTSGRPRAFQRCRLSVLAQTERAFHLVSSDDERDLYPEGSLIVQVSRQPGTRSENLYFNEMRAAIPDRHPWCVFLDDDDTFTRADALERIKQSIVHDDCLIIWRVRIGSNVIPSSFDRKPKLGEITGIGFSFHKKNWIDWAAKTAGDFEVFSALYDRLTPIWIPEILTEFQGRPGGGQRRDF